MFIRHILRAPKPVRIVSWSATITADESCRTANRKTRFISTYKRAELSAASRDIVLETCLAGRGRLFDLHAIVVMPDHVHLMLTPRADTNGTISIPEITQAIKSTSAHLINKYLGRKGKVWQEESFDRAMREVENARAKIEYVLGNPVRAGLVKKPNDYRWLWTESCTGEDARASKIV